MSEIVRSRESGVTGTSVYSPPPTGTASMSRTSDNRSVFVVHRRNKALRKTMFDVLRSINLSLIEWTTAVELTGSDRHTTGDFTAQPSPGDGLMLGPRLPSAAPVRKPVDLDLKYFDKGRDHSDKLQVINRGTETAYDVKLTVPEKAGIDLRSTGLPAIPRSPGGRCSVTIDLTNKHCKTG